MAQNFSSDQAWELLCEWTQSPSLRKHVLAVQAAMQAYAKSFGEDVELWGTVGLLHDLDYERYPSAEDGHPRYAMAELQRLGYSAEIVRAIASHADYMGVPRETQMEKTLFAVDELCGFIMACAYVRPEGVHGMTPKSLQKKLKTASFAAAISRKDVRAGAEELGVDLDEHIAFVISALEPMAQELGIAGSSGDNS